MTNTYPVLNSIERAVSFQNQGLRMWGMLHLPGASGTHPAVLMLHGITGDKTGSHRLFVHAARAFAAHGIAALRFDMCGSGDSEGEFQDMTLRSEVSDAQVALEWLLGQPQVDGSRLGVLGLSLGGMVTSMLVGHNPHLVRGVAYWAAAANADTITHMAQRTATEGKTTTESLVSALARDGYIMFWRYPLGLPLVQDLIQQQPLEELTHYRGRALIVHSVGDPTVPVSQVDVYASVFGDRAEIYRLEENTHSFENPAAERQAIELTVNWFDRVFSSLPSTPG